MMWARRASLVFAAMLLSTGAQAHFVISDGATEGVTCSAGTCTAIVRDAVLNASELMTMLGAGDVTVTQDRGKVIAVQAALFWSNTSRLTIHSRREIRIDAPISVAGTGGLTLKAGGDTWINYAPGASISFWDGTSSLIINDHAYVLVDSIAQMQATSAAYVALRKDYDAAADGVFAHAPIRNHYFFDGLGHTISNFHLDNATADEPSGLFVRGDTILHFHMTDASVKGVGGAIVGVIAGDAFKLFDVSATGTVETGATTPGFQQATAGGLAGTVNTYVQNSWADVAVHAGTGSYVGGLVGFDFGAIDNSHATGTVTSAGGTGSAAGGLLGYSGIIALIDSYASGAVSGAQYGGGLVGYSQGVNIHQVSASGSVAGGAGATLGGLFGYLDQNASRLERCFATGAVTAAGAAIVGGLVGENHGEINDCYATGAVSGPSGSTVGGLVGLHLFKIATS
jgi:hypothetical protein